jgi:hypothetical protein
MTTTSFSSHFSGLDSAPKGALACFTAKFFETVNGCPAWVEVAFANRPVARQVFSAVELFDTVIRQPHRTPFTIIPSVSACSQLGCRLAEKNPEMTGESRIFLLIQVAESLSNETDSGPKFGDFAGLIGVPQYLPHRLPYATLYTQWGR